MAEPVRAPFTAYIGGMAEDIREGHARISLQSGPQHADAFGRVHGGVLTSLMDSVIGIALGRLRGEDARQREGPHATIDMTTNFYAYASPGDEIICEGGVTRLERDVAFGDVEARRSSDNELLAKAQLTFVIRRNQGRRNMPLVYLGLGSNLGNREANLRMAIGAMTRLAKVVAGSSLYETDPVGPEQPPFHNAVVAIETGLQPLPLLRFLKGIEEEIGRRPGGPPQGPRPIDIDILLYGDETIEADGLTVPHKRIAERAFVLVPLAEIAPDIRHPALEKTIAELQSAVGSDGVRKIADPGWDGYSGRTPDRVRI